MTSKDITRALAMKHWQYWKHVCVPRCEFSPLGEADLLVMQPSGDLEEIEIKISTSDFKREFTNKEYKHLVLPSGVPKIVHPRTRDGVVTYDFKEPGLHLIRRYWFAMPEDLAAKHVLDIPAYAGLLSVGKYRRVTVVKKAPTLKHSRKLTEAEQRKMLRLAYLRFWKVEEKEDASI